MKAGRLVNLLLLLQTRGQMQAADLARELEVSVRTVHRDVEALSEAGVPIYAERGRHGGIRLVDGYRTRLTGLTGDEASALFLSGLRGPAAELGLASVVADAQLKVLAALPAELRGHAARMAARLHLDAPVWFRESDPVPFLQPLADATLNDRPFRMRYDREGGLVSRDVEPLGLVVKGGVWYLVGRCEGDLRTYRVSRVRSVMPLEGSFERPKGFDLATFWAESVAAYERDLPRIEVIFRLAPRAGTRFEEVVGRRAAERAMRSTATDPDGWRRMRLSFEWLDAAEATMLQLGGDAEILEPAELREQIARTGRAIVERYAHAAT